MKAFERASFEVVRTNGSHDIMKRAGHPNRLAIPVHADRTVSVWLLKSQIVAARLAVDEFNDLL